MSQRGPSVWSQLDWIDRLEVTGMLIMLGYAALAVVDPVLASSLFNSIADPARAFFESLG